METAAWFGHAQVVKGLIALGADVHCSMEAPLRYAVQQGNDETVAVLIEAGASMRDAIFNAAERRDVELVRQLAAYDLANPRSRFTATFKKAVDELTVPANAPAQKNPPPAPA
jgi:ankyrin repeat protein